jgi:hypothetical protein
MPWQTPSEQCAKGNKKKMAWPAQEMEADMEKNDAIEILCALRIRIEDIRPFKGRADMLKKIYSSIELVRQHKNDPALYRLLISQAEMMVAMADNIESGRNK